MFRTSPLQPRNIGSLVARREGANGDVGGHGDAAPVWVCNQDARPEAGDNFLSARNAMDRDKKPSVLSALSASARGQLRPSRRGPLWGSLPFDFGNGSEPCQLRSAP